MLKTRKIDSRPYRVKGAKVNFFCALCRAPRALRFRSKLNSFHYLQIIAISALLITLSFPLMKERSFFWPFVVFAAFEFFNKLLFRKEIPCPHCGFDATWYRRDVKVAKKIVKDFWQAPAVVPSKAESQNSNSANQ